MLCSNDAGSAATGEYYRTVMVWVIMGFCLAQLVVLLITWPQKIGRLRKPMGTLSSLDNSQKLYCTCINRFSETPALSNILPLYLFDAVGWAAGRASGLQKIEWRGAGMVICLE